MSTTTRPDVAAIEHLDFEPTIPCEHSAHAARHADEPAMFLVGRDACPRCGRSAKTYALCLSGWELMGRVGIRCPPHRGGCGYESPRDERMTILRVIGGPR